jgi:hypothetical protein
MQKNDNIKIANRPFENVVQFKYFGTAGTKIKFDS